MWSWKSLKATPCLGNNSAHYYVPFELFLKENVFLSLASVISQAHAFLKAEYRDHQKISFNIT